MPLKLLTEYCSVPPLVPSFSDPVATSLPAMLPENREDAELHIEIKFSQYLDAYQKF